MPNMANVLSDPPQTATHHQAAITTNVAQTRDRLSKLLQLHGYSACREALVLLEDHLTSSSKYESIEDFVSKLNHVVTFQTNACTSIIDPELAHLVIQKLNNPAGSDHQPVIDLEEQQVLPELPAQLSIKVKNVEYDHVVDKRKQSFVANNSDEFNIHYNFLFKRISELSVFQDNFQLMKLSTLTASTQPSIRCICFGLLIKDISKIDGYLLIDSSGRVPVRITPDTTFRNRLAYTNCLVLVEGVYANPDDVLYAANIGLPPVLLDPVMDKSQACADDKFVVMLKELYLDDDDVVSALEMLFTGYNSLEDPPMLFILIGDFTRQNYELSQYRAHMKKLIRILRSCDNLKNCHFVFIPGQRDTSPVLQDSNNPSTNSSGSAKAPLTKEQLPVNLLQLSDFHNVHLATNPTHIYLGERQISVVAHSYMKELRKYLLHDLSDHREELFETVKKIILSNAHLSAGSSKHFHSSMKLWHRPDLLILADTEAFGNRYDYSSSQACDTSFCTIPSFARQSNQFKVYYIKSGEIEDSQVSSEAYQEIEEDEEQLPDASEEVVELE